jgi:hypothetical protein
MVCVYGYFWEFVIISRVNGKNNLHCNTLLLFRMCVRFSYHFFIIQIYTIRDYSSYFDSSDNSRVSLTYVSVAGFPSSP